MTMIMRVLLMLMVVAAPATAAKGKPKGKGKGKPPAVEVAPEKEKEKTVEPDKAAVKADEPARPAGDPRARSAEAGSAGPSRIEFDDRLVQGQTNKANAIYLFERRESALRSLLKKRSNFRDEIDERLYE